MLYPQAQLAAHSQWQEKNQEYQQAVSGGSVTVKASGEPLLPKHASIPERAEQLEDPSPTPCLRLISAGH